MVEVGEAPRPVHTAPQGGDSLVVVSDTVHLVGEVHCEGDAI